LQAALTSGNLHLKCVNRVWKALARASNTPRSHTRNQTFLQLPRSITLVDLPGYGYANAPLPIVEKWQRLLKQYLSGRPDFATCLRAD